MSRAKSKAVEITATDLYPPSTLYHSTSPATQPSFLLYSLSQFCHSIVSEHLSKIVCVLMIILNIYTTPYTYTHIPYIYIYIY